MTLLTVARYRFVADTLVSMEHGPGSMLFFMARERQRIRAYQLGYMEMPWNSVLG
jgi:hypothetical protein